MTLNLLLAQILNVRIGAEARVIREIPSWMIGIVVNYDVIRVPHPIAYITSVIWRYSKEEAVKAEAVRIAAAEPPTMPWSETASKAPVLIGLLHVIVAIVAPRVVAHPLSAIVDVRSIRVARPVAVVALVIALVVVTVVALLMSVTILMLIALIWMLIAVILILIASILVRGAAVWNGSACRRSYLVLVPGTLTLISTIPLPILLGESR